MSKGSKQRPTNAKKFGDNYDKAFPTSDTRIIWSSKRNVEPDAPSNLLQHTPPDCSHIVAEDDKYILTLHAKLLAQAKRIAELEAILREMEAEPARPNVMDAMR